MPYISRDTSIIQTILQENYDDFENIYDEVYAKDCGIFRLERITGSVSKFTGCRDWNQEKQKNNADLPYNEDYNEVLNKSSKQSWTRLIQKVY